MNANNSFRGFAEEMPVQAVPDAPGSSGIPDVSGKAGVPGSGGPVSTVSPALDVIHPSNYERLASFYRAAPAVMRNMVFPETVDDRSTLEAIEGAWRDYGIHLDPQGAVALAAARRTAAREDFNGHIVILATAHPAKYADLLYQVTGERLSLPEKLASLTREAPPVAEIEPDLEGLESAIAGCF
jgi:threonine synthase